MSEKEVENYLSKQLQISKLAYEKEKQSCKAVDMRPGLGPVRDQDSVGWCYAFASADLLSYKTKQRISAADIALTHNKDFMTDIGRMFGRAESSFGGGWPEDAIEKASEKGLCLEKDLPSEDNENSSIKTNLDTIDSLLRGRGRMEALNCAETISGIKKVFPNLEMSDIHKIVSTTFDQDIVQKMVDKTCKNRIKLKPEIETESNKDKLAQVIDDNLDKTNPNPLGLDYDSSVLYNKNSPVKLANHASIIAGRRFNEKSGQCDYLIRNSWGRGCSLYDQKLSCEEGNIWIPKVDVIERAYNVTFIK